MLGMMVLHIVLDTPYRSYIAVSKTRLSCHKTGLFSRCSVRDSFFQMRTHHDL